MAATFRHTTLDNGLHVIAECDDQAHSAACGYFVRTGARDESTDLMGVSHFLEHMMFKGTEGMSAEELNRRFDELGARNNAYTSTEMTCFYAHVIPEMLDPATRTLAEMMRPALRQSDFDTEKEVIVEEIAMYDDDPFSVLYEAFMERYYGGHPLGHRVLGTKETIRAMSRDAMHGYFTHRYAADNTTVAFAGPIDFDHVVDEVEKRCADWNSSGVSRDHGEPTRVPGDFTIEGDFARGYLLAASPAPSVQDDRRYASHLLSQLLGAPGNSQLHWALVETGLAEHAQAFFDPHDLTGDLFVFASGAPGDLDTIWSTIRDELGRVVEKTTERDLERLRNKLMTTVTLSEERPADRMQRIGRTWCTTGEYRPLDEELRKIGAVTVADIAELVERFPMDAMTVGRLVPPAG